MMPHWLQGMVALSSGIVVVLGLVFVLAMWSNLQAKAQPAFSRDQKEWLDENYRNGSYLSASTFRWCESGQFLYTDPTAAKWTLRETCLEMMPKR